MEIVVIILLVVFFYLPAKFAALVLHELGHYFMCRSLRVTPFWVEIGTGAMLFKFNHKGTWFQIRKSLSSGEVAVAPGYMKKMGLWGAISMIIAGPLAQLCFALGLGILPRYILSNSSIQTALLALSLIVAFDAIQQLKPVQKTVEIDGKKKKMRTDGFQIRNLWRRREQFRTINSNW